MIDVEPARSKDQHEHGRLDREHTRHHGPGQDRHDEHEAEQPRGERRLGEELGDHGAPDVRPGPLVVYA